MRYAVALARIYKAQVLVYHCEEVAPMAVIPEVQHRVTETISGTSGG